MKFVNKNLVKKSLVCGASLLMLAGAGASSLSNVSANSYTPTFNKTVRYAKWVNHHSLKDANPNHIARAIGYFNRYYNDWSAKQKKIVRNLDNNEHMIMWVGSNGYRMPAFVQAVHFAREFNNGESVKASHVAWAKYYFNTDFANWTPSQKAMVHALNHNSTNTVWFGKTSAKRSAIRKANKKVAKRVAKKHVVVKKVSHKSVNKKSVKKHEAKKATKRTKKVARKHVAKKHASKRVAKKHLAKRIAKRTTAKKVAKKHVAKRSGRTHFAKKHVVRHIVHKAIHHYVRKHTAKKVTPKRVAKKVTPKRTVPAKQQVTPAKPVQPVAPKGKTNNTNTNDENDNDDSALNNFFNNYNNQQAKADNAQQANDDENAEASSNDPTINTNGWDMNTDNPYYNKTPEYAYIDNNNGAHTIVQHYSDGTNMTYPHVWDNSNSGLRNWDNFSKYEQTNPTGAHNWIMNAKNYYNYSDNFNNK